MRRAVRVAGRVVAAALIAALAGCEGGSAPQGMVKIPAGSFQMGSDKVDTEGKGNEFGMAKPLYQDEHPRREINLPTYSIDRYETTNAEYGRYIEATKARPPKTWPDGRVPAGRERLPVTNVNWYEAEQYCRWAGKRLPTEAEWEKAARGTDGREYPWGNEFDEKKANTGGAGVNDLAPVGSFPQGKSPYGVEDMAGNVWEWTADWYQPYPGSTYESKDFGQKFKVLRGSSWGGTGHYALSYFYRSAHRFYIAPEMGFADAGVRCARSG